VTESSKIPIFGANAVWGKRRFAYAINHMTEGYYSVITFDGDVELQSVLDRSLALLDSVVRHKILRKTAKV